MPELFSREYGMIFVSAPPTSFQLVILPVKIPLSWSIEISVSGLLAFTYTDRPSLATVIVCVMPGGQTPELLPPLPPPAALPDDITGQARVDLADQAIAHLEKAVALRPHHADALTYLALVWRQKSFGLFAEPAAWQQAIDRANEWQKRACAERTGKS